ncbi:MAG: hypothetical protein ACD_43C00069G0004 [uncultured bacterium]|nr:MAG: hypothetical protein ACD_43C00069G0004 [uncultured bacterium]
MKRQLILFVSLVWLTSTIQIGWLWPAPATTLTFNSAFVVIGILVFVVRWPLALWFSLAQGLLIDLFSPFVFGTYTAASLLLVICIGLLQDTWLKQHSLLSVATIAALSITLVQVLVISSVALSEYSDIILTHSVAAITVLPLLIGLSCMIGLTAIGARLFTRQYVKFI